MTIKLLDVVKYFDNLSHQIDAVIWLQENIPNDVLEKFENKWRKEPKKEITLSESKKEINTWEDVYQAAKKAGAKYPDCVCAQWALESGWGKHFSGKYNAFGLKGTGSTVNTKEFVNDKWITIQAGFIDFPDLQTCVSYLVDRWYKDFGGFKGVNRAESRNECARLLVQEGYATDPDYADKLMQIMDRQLQNFGEKPSDNPHHNSFDPSSPYTYKVTPHITYGELTLNQEARRFTKQYQCETAKKLCLFLERVRKNFGDKPIIITSASRPEPINTEVGGAKNSEHTYSNPSKGAIDFYIKDVPLLDVQDWCDKNWTYSLGYGAEKGFVHIGIREERTKIRWNY